MSELSRMIESRPVVKVIDKEYTLYPIQLRHIGAGQVAMRGNRPSVVREAAQAAEGLSAETKKLLFDSATAEYSREHTITISEAMVWLTQHPDGIAFLLWFMIQESAGTPTPAGLPSQKEIANWLANLSPAAANDIVDALLMASGGDTLGNYQSTPSAATG